MAPEPGWKELLKNGLMTGLGAAVVSKRRVEELTQRLAAQGKLSAQEAEKLAQDLMSAGREQLEELEGDFQNRVRNSVENLGVARQDELRALRQRVDQLEHKVDMLLAKFQENSGRS